MKSSKILVVFILVFTLLAVSTACGNYNTGSSGEQQATAEQLIPTAETSASVDGLIGSWTNISANDRFANITKTDTGYQYEDNDGKYPATFADGVLKVNVSDSDSDTADVYIDAKTGHMLTVYQGSISEYSLK